MRRFSIIVAGLALALGVTPVHADDFFAGCSNDTTGRVRKIQVNSLPICRSTETLRIWNQSGPQGDPGEPGFTSCHVETFAGTCNANTFAVLNASCSVGNFATWASAIWMTPFAAANNGKFYLYARDGDTWTAIPYNDTGVTQDFEVQLQCCN